MLEERAFGGIFSDGELHSFMQRLEGEVTERHQRFGASVYLLEPDVKNGAGGLRDLDIALWAARARWRVKSVRRSGPARRARAARGQRDQRRAAIFLWAVRNHLHHHAGRRSDRLTFEEQETVAAGDGLPRARSAGSPTIATMSPGAMVETFMSDYYRHARIVTRAREQIITRATPRVGPQAPARRGSRSRAAHLRRADHHRRRQRARHRSGARRLRLYATAIARSMPVLPFARDAIARVARDPAFGAALRANPRSGLALRAAGVDCARDAACARARCSAELHDVGLLLAMIPEFTPVVGRVHHDLYHVYTVDVHSVAAVDRLRALVRGDLAHEYPARVPPRRRGHAAGGALSRHARCTTWARPSAAKITREARRRHGARTS